MEKRALGKTGLEVSIMSFGGIPIQKVSEAESIKIIQKAIEQGMNFIDTARAYNDSEQKIGLAIQNKRDQVIVASKSMARTKNDMLNQIDQSLKELKTDYIDLYQAHNVSKKEEIDMVLAPGGALEGLQEAHRVGKIGHIGFSSHNAEMASSLLEGSSLWETVQFPYNFLERQAEEKLFPLARNRNLGIIAMKPLAGGSFKNPELALRWLLHQNITCIIPGVDNLQQIDINTKIALDLKKLNEDEIEKLQQEASELGKYFCRRCGYCKPCPQGIDISMFFILHGYFERYGLPEWAQERYREGFKIRADSCTECGICESKCPYGLRIREKLKKVHCDLA